MPSPFVPSLLAGLAALPIVALPQGPIASQTPIDPLHAGRWTGPFDLDISCSEHGTCRYCSSDEIGHATLIPTGPHAGRILLWTRCDSTLVRPSDPYYAHVWDPTTQRVVDAPPFTAALPIDQGPFCSGHAWMLDTQGSPKFLIVGGNDYSTLDLPYPASTLVTWFDPAPASGAPGWFDGPEDLPDPSWYPSVLLFENSAAQRFEVLALGGTEEASGGCSSRYKNWWTLGSPFTSWVEQPKGSYEWHTYPRTFLLADGDIMCVGHDVNCELYPNTYGGNPVQRIRATPVTAQTRSPGPDPNTQTALPIVPVGSWNTNNAVLLHTLKPGWVFDPALAVDQYDRDRIISLNGSYESFGDDQQLLVVPALPYVLELLTSPVLVWTKKASPPTPRVFSNAVLLPDGAILVVGGQDTWPQQDPVVNPYPTYCFSAERLDPSTPTSQGSWRTLSSTRVVGDENGFPYGTPRGYHSVALLLKDGSVALGGGQPDQSGLYARARSDDTFEIFEPPYVFAKDRPSLVAAPATIHYGEVFEITVDVAEGRSIERARLMGLSNVTHHFDYGQRLVDLMVRETSGPAPLASSRPTARTPRQQGTTTRTYEVIAPPLAAMAPASCYVLFAVDARAGSDPVPSEGLFLTVTY